MTAVEDSVTNEAFSMALAEAMKLSPARSNICSVLNRPFLLVERYDRQLDPRGQLQRLHQEDFC
ncbi:HipA domain-containing protein [Fluviibacter phosphoraccumulans]|uniref:HipA domain-containing protein n=1 Tax=Fluviibacter phosphoraccumulans TaxID=1751046 RepID=UPI003AB161EF